MTTAVIQIGNSDNKLTQKEWAEFVSDLTYLLHPFTCHFSGGANCAAPWQNYCWVIEMQSLDGLRNDLAQLAKDYGQDSIALTIGDTEFVAASP